MSERYDTLVVGGGFAGSVMAERLTDDLGRRVLVVDRRPQIAGNAYDHLDEHGVLIHRYGAHIFHTNTSSTRAPRATPTTPSPRPRTGRPTSATRRRPPNSPT